MKPEQRLQIAICDYIRLKYPKAMFMISPSGIKLTQGQAKNLKRSQNPSKGWPDLLIFKTKIDPSVNGLHEWAGLLIELKAEGTILYKKDGSMRKNEHTQNQNAMHLRLHQEGYFATFATGFDETKKIVDWYLK